MKRQSHEGEKMHAQNGGKINQVGASSSWISRGPTYQVAECGVKTPLP
jgi:hypothetical protein